jgi:hypothetical protein
MGQPLSSGVPSVAPRARQWQPALGVLVAFAGGIAAAVAFQVPIGDSGSLSLICYGVIVLVASLTGGTLFRSRWAALAVSGALMLGMDDWSFRRGWTYGTILSDLERHHLVDLLPERTGRRSGGT